MSTYQLSLLTKSKVVANYNQSNLLYEICLVNWKETYFCMKYLLEYNSNWFYRNVHVFLNRFLRIQWQHKLFIRIDSNRYR